MDDCNKSLRMMPGNRLLRAARADAKRLLGDHEVCHSGSAARCPALESASAKVELLIAQEPRHRAGSAESDQQL